MAMEAVKIPQNVYVEDRIIGPVTLKQLMIIGIGTAFSYVLYATVTQGGPVSVPVTIMLWSPAIVAAAFAFLKVNDITLFNIILLWIEHMNKPVVRSWSPHPGISINIVTRPPKEEKKTDAQKIDISRKLTEVTHQVERRQEDLARLSIPTQPAATPLDGVQSVSTDTPAEVKVSTKPADEIAKEPTPVRKERVQVEGSVHGPSIDGISDDLTAFSHIFSKSAQ
ncbi:MAG: PrgI family protein [Candidatus Peribacteraceae bacterium]|nr:PrgI family protein [Candidatus Peribacteraceae bacterium]